MWYFGPPRSKFGKWIKRNGLTQMDVARMSGVSHTTISALATGKTKKPTRLVSRKLIDALRQVDPSVKAKDFWDV